MARDMATSTLPDPLPILVLTTGGTIDKVYFDAVSYTHLTLPTKRIV